MSWQAVSSYHMTPEYRNRRTPSRNHEVGGDGSARSSRGLACGETCCHPPPLQPPPPHGLPRVSSHQGGSTWVGSLPPGSSLARSAANGQAHHVFGGAPFHVGQPSRPRPQSRGHRQACLPTFLDTPRAGRGGRLGREARLLLGGMRRSYHGCQAAQDAEGSDPTQEQKLPEADTTPGVCDLQVSSPEAMPHHSPKSHRRHRPDVERGLWRT